MIEFIKIFKKQNGNLTKTLTIADIKKDILEEWLDTNIEFAFQFKDIVLAKNKELKNKANHALSLLKNN